MKNLKDYGIEMWDKAKIISFRKTLLNWYDLEKRDLPWRRTKNPYHIWISEIMLQQTQVVTVIPYYERFLEWFPKIDDLANADEERLLKAWEGLGYYSRVRNMQAAAKQIMTEFNGVFPSHYHSILSLKGIGPYTAGAIASIAFDLPEPAVDGNVMRVIARLFEVNADIGDPKNRGIFQEIMTILIDPDRPGDFNQALMDLGTDIESAKNPRPEESPIRAFNAAYLHQTYDKYPIKLPKKKPKTLYFQAFVIQNEKNEFLLEKNTSGRLLGGFWSFPLIEQSIEPQQLNLFNTEKTVEQPRLMSQEKNFERNYQYQPKWTSSQFEVVKHTFSHQKWHIRLKEGFVKNSDHLTSENITWVKIKDLEKFPLATPQKKMMATYFNENKN